ncbi:MAG: hypothetical protein IJ635_11270 [Bacteroidaceae bacterium]|nr:hypothetical protein [Bacteroidaceae bacterium]
MERYEKVGKRAVSTRFLSSKFLLSITKLSVEGGFTASFFCHPSQNLAEYPRILWERAVRRTFAAVKIKKNERFENNENNEKS